VKSRRKKGGATPSTEGEDGINERAGAAQMKRQHGGKKKRKKKTTTLTTGQPEFPGTTRKQTRAAKNPDPSTKKV